MMKKDELRMYAVEGVRQRLLAIERECHALYREFPDLFIGDGPPEFVRAEVISSNGHAPTQEPVRIIVRPPRSDKGTKRGPNARRRKGHGDRTLKNVRPYEKIAAFLRDHARAHLADIARAMHEKNGGSAQTYHKLKAGVERGFYVKHEDATYSLGPTPVSRS